MISLLKKPYAWGLIYSALLVLFTLFVMLEAFVIPQKGDGEYKGPLISFTNETPTSDPSSDIKYPIITENSYTDRNISIVISEIRRFDTTCYVADVKLSSISFLKTGFANNQYGKNITERTSAMAKRLNAIFAINGDYYGFRNSGFVIRNGCLYRTEPRTGKSRDGMTVFYDGTFKAYDELNEDAELLHASGAYQTFTFGPTLLNNGELSVSKSAEVDAALASNQRAGIGIIEPLHYLFIVSNGRIENEAGMSVYQFAKVFEELGCQTAYNLDGGGSATMWFMGKILNVTTSDGENVIERKVSDCVYIGYE